MKQLIIVCAALLLASGCGSDDSASTQAPELMLYCGAGIRPAADKLIEAFEAKYPVKVNATYAGSGRLLGQLSASRQGDLFMPGSAFYVDQAVEKGLADPDTRQRVAYFIPVIFVQKGNPLDVTSLQDLAAKDMRIGLGDERAVAVGRRAKEIFEKNRISYKDVLERVVYNSGTVNELGVAIEMKNVDAVIMWNANARQFADAGDAIPIPPEENIVSTIPIAALTFSRYPTQAKQFIDFVVSEEGRSILKEQRYTVTLDE